MKSILSICVIVIAIATVSCQAQTKTVNYNLTVKEFDKLSKETPDAVIVDVRSPVEYVEAYIPNAVNIDYTGKYWVQSVGILDKNKTYFLYCLGGSRSEEAADYLRGQGITKVYNLKGGFSKWQEEGMPTAKHDVNLRGN